MKIYQIFFKEEHIPYLRPDLISYDNSNDTSLKFEYGIMSREYFAGNIPDDDYTGFISWKWSEKTSVSINDWIKNIEMNPGYDCYAFNPHDWVTQNIWVQGDASSYKHIKMSVITQQMIDKLGYSCKILDRRYTKDEFAFCNYWVANKKFWDEYIAFMEPFSNMMIANNKMYDNLFFDSEVPLYGYYPYIIERLWSEFIWLKKDTLKTKIFHKENVK